MTAAPLQWLSQQAAPQPVPASWPGNRNPTRCTLTVISSSQQTNSKCFTPHFNFLLLLSENGNTPVYCKHVDNDWKLHFSKNMNSIE